MSHVSAVNPLAGKTLTVSTGVLPDLTDNTKETIHTCTDSGKLVAVIFGLAENSANISITSAVDIDGTETAGTHTSGVEDDETIIYNYYEVRTYPLTPFNTDIVCYLTVDYSFDMLVTFATVIYYK